MAEFLAVLRRRRSWAGLWPRRIPGAWRRTHWLWWTWDRVTGAEAMELGAAADLAHAQPAAAETVAEETVAEEEPS